MSFLSIFKSVGFQIIQMVQFLSKAIKLEDPYQEQLLAGRQKKRQGATCNAMVLPLEAMPRLLTRIIDFSIWSRRRTVWRKYIVVVHPLASSQLGAHPPLPPMTDPHNEYNYTNTNTQIRIHKYNVNGAHPGIKPAGSSSTPPMTDPQLRIQSHK